MKVAILMSVYNGGRFLKEQMESIARQTVAKDIELYIRDDGSPNGSSAAFFEEWKDRISLHYAYEENLGPAYSFWRLFTDRSIKADYYLFCDQDDIWDEDKVEKQIESLADHADVSACNCRLVNADGIIIQDSRLTSEPDFSMRRLFVSGVTQGCSLCFTNEFREKLLGFQISCIPMHDIILLLYASMMGKIVWIQEPLFSYRIHENNVVAKNGNPILNVKNTVRNWKNGSRNSMSQVASEMILNGVVLNDYDKKFILAIKCYKINIKSKFEILNNEKLKVCDRRIAFAYKIRVLFNLL